MKPATAVELVACVGFAIVGVRIGLGLTWLIFAISLVLLSVSEGMRERQIKRDAFMAGASALRDLLRMRGSA
jgi:uncharacterized membrane protein YciS (DUF1049 family)